MTTRRGFFATAASGLAWLMGVRIESNPYRFAPIPKLGEPYGTGSTATAASVHAHAIAENFWQVVVEYSDKSTKRGVAVSSSLHAIFNGKHEWLEEHRPKDKPASPLPYGYYGMQPCEVFCNGEKLKKCTKANAIEGWAECYTTDSNGRHVFSGPKTPATHRVYGNIVIRYTESKPCES